ncbi:MAG TPA: hypothetical protein VH589_08325, partial [Trebonia sp.]
TDLGVPLGACLARQRPGIRDIRIRYRDGRFWNFESRQLAARASAQGRYGSTRTPANSFWTCP